MKNILGIALMSLFLLMNQQAYAQKVGHINSADLLTSLDAWKAIEMQLQNHVKMLEDKIKAQDKALRDEFDTFQKNIDNFTPKQVEEKKKYFQGKQGELEQAQKNAQQELAKKEAELTDPIRQKVKDALSAVAKEGGYTYIIDLNMGDVLYADPALDLTNLVKSKIK